MAKLTAAARKKIPSSKFAGPDRSYPIPDKAHAANAKARAAQFASPSEKAKIDAKADTVLHAKKGISSVPWGGKGAGKATKPKTVGPIKSDVLGSMVKSLR
jgi:hypothetical protein